MNALYARPHSVLNPRTTILTHVALAAVGLGLLAITAGCGSEQSGSPASDAVSSTDTATTRQTATPPESTAAIGEDRLPEVSIDPAQAKAATDLALQEKYQRQHPVVAIQTNFGILQVELDLEKAPITSSNFLEYVRSTFYDGTIFHYVNHSANANGMMLGGGYTPELKSKEPFLPIRNEAHNGLKNLKGTIAMSRDPASIDSATCQFFINTKDNPQLDHRGNTPDEYGYCVFGRVVEGMEVVQQIAQFETHDEGQWVNTPKKRVVIEKIRMLR